VPDALIKARRPQHEMIELQAAPLRSPACWPAKA
jgi:hypothetical protein